MDLLRQIVASPRSRHPEAGLDLCYVTDNIIATSGPSGTYPQVAYRNPLKELVKFLDGKHGAQWAIWEFRAEGTGYPDDEVYGRIRHYPWPDHHPPPFALVPLIMASMRNWLQAADAEGRVAVVHCKAGKGRSGTVSCSYLISEEGWTPEDAMARFTQRRMRPGFGAGISIPSQLRWIGYVDRWTRHGKVYADRQVEIVEVHLWGLRDGVKIAIEGFVDEGKVIKTFHTFGKHEREIVRGEISTNSGFADVATEVLAALGGKKNAEKPEVDKLVEEAEEKKGSKNKEAPADSTLDDDADAMAPSGEVIFRPAQRVVLPTSDVNIDIERRNRSKYGGFTMVTSVAHVWFNIFFEGRGPEQAAGGGAADDAGVFEIAFDAMDGIKGSSRKGTKCFDRMAVVWKAAQPEVTIITEPPPGEEVAQTRPADWQGGGDGRSAGMEKKLGLREATSASADISPAASSAELKDEQQDQGKGLEDEGVRSHATANAGAEAQALDGTNDATMERASKTESGEVVNTDELPGHDGHVIGSMKLAHNIETSS